MHHLLRLRHLMTLLGLVAVGLLPVYAIHPNVGGNLNDFTVLAADQVSVSVGGSAAVNGGGAGGVAGSPGRSGAVNGFIGGTVTSNPGGNISGGISSTAVSELAALKSGLAAYTPTFSAGGTTDLRTLDIDGGGAIPAGTLTPGVYSFADVTVSDSGGTPDLTFSGEGEYIINISGGLTTAPLVQMSLANGANAADIFWNVTGTANIAGGNEFTGLVLAGNGITVGDETTVSGKLLTTGDDVAFTDDGGGPVPTVNDAGFPPDVTVNGAVPPQGGTNLTVNQDGDNSTDLLYSIVADDTEAASITIERLSVTPPSAAAGFESPASVVGADAVAMNEDFDPDTAIANGLPAGTTVVVTYQATDGSGAVTDFTVNIYVNFQPVVGINPGSVTGQAPLASGTGTAMDPFVACVGDEFSFVYTGTDPAMDGGPTTLNATVTPSSASFDFDPDVPVVSGGDSASTEVTLNATPADANTTFEIEFTTTDELGATTTESVFVYVSGLPTFAAPFTEPGLDVVTACVGQLVQFDISASDSDTGEDVQLSVEGTPIGASHDPNLLGSDESGINGGDLLVAGDVDEDGAPSVATTRFQWTPMPGDVGSHTLTYTAEDVFGCIQTTTVTVVVTESPEISATSGGPVEEGEVLVVCPGDTLTVPITGTGTVGNTLELSQTGAPVGATFSPTLPTTDTDGTVTSTLSFTPNVMQAGSTSTVTVTVNDTTADTTLAPDAAGVVQCDPSDTLTFVIQVANVPVFTATALGDDTTLVGTTPTGTTINTCTGDPVSFRIRATDPDAGETVTLGVSGAPAGSLFTPGLPAVGNPVETDFTWTAGASGQSVIAFTATDSAGCESTFTVTINVSAVPTIAITGVSGQESGAGTEVDPYVVCVGATPAFTFTVTGADADGAQTVTLSQTGAPAGMTLGGGFPAMGNPVARTLTFSPTADQGGETFEVEFTATDNSAALCSTSTSVFIRVSSLPVITATPDTITVCEGEEIEYRVRATDADPGNVTIGVPTITDSDPSEGSPSLTLVHTPTVPTAGNPVETVVTSTTPDVAITTTYTITYTATDSDGCTTTEVVTVIVQATAPTTVSLSQQPGGDVQVGQEVCYVAVVRDNCPTPRPVAGVPVCFEVIGTTGNNTPGAGNGGGTGSNGTSPQPRGVTVITDENGEARLCFTPVFPGTNTITAVIDFNGDCVADPGTTGATSNITVPPPVQLGPGCFASGKGKVDVADPFFGDRPVVGSFNFDVSPTRSNGFKGKVGFVVPAAGVGRRGNITVSSTRIESMLCGEGPIGRTALIFGQARVKGHPDVSGLVRFRVDALDAGTPGIPGDRFTITFLTPDGFVLSGPVGGNLDFGRRSRNDDIKIRPGVRVR